MEKFYLLHHTVIFWNYSPWFIFLLISKSEPLFCWCKDSHQGLGSISTCPVPCICERTFSSPSHTCRALPTMHHGFNPPPQNQQPLLPSLHSHHSAFAYITSILCQDYFSHIKRKKKQKHKKQDPRKHVWLLYNPLSVCKINLQCRHGGERQGPGLPPTTLRRAHAGQRSGSSSTDGWTTSPRWHPHHFDAWTLTQNQLTFLQPKIFFFYYFYSQTDDVLHLFSPICCY